MPTSPPKLDYATPITKRRPEIRPMIGGLFSGFFFLVTLIFAFNGFMRVGTPERYTGYTLLICTGLGAVGTIICLYGVRLKPHLIGELFVGLVGALGGAMMLVIVGLILRLHFQSRGGNWIVGVPALSLFLGFGAGGMWIVWRRIKPMWRYRNVKFSH